MLDARYLEKGANMTPWNDQTVTERHREAIKIKNGVFIFFDDSADIKYAKTGIALAWPSC
jgi:hypothetical protein